MVVVIAELAALCFVGGFDEDFAEYSGFVEPWLG